MKKYWWSPVLIIITILLLSVLFVTGTLSNKEIKNGIFFGCGVDRSCWQDFNFMQDYYKDANYTNCNPNTSCTDDIDCDSVARFCNDGKCSCPIYD